MTEFKRKSKMGIIKKDIDLDKANQVIEGATADRYLEAPQLPDVRVRKMLNLPTKLHNAFLSYQLASRKAGQRITFQGLVEELLKRHLKDFIEK